MSFNLNRGPYKHYWIPKQWSDDAVFKLIDEDLTNAFNTISTVFWGGKENMSLDAQSREIGYNEGFKEGYYKRMKEEQESHINTSSEVRPKSMYNRIDDLNKDKTQDSRMQAESLPRLHCSNQTCRIELTRYDLQAGLVYEHSNNKFCENDGKYIYIKRLIYNSQ